MEKSLMVSQRKGDRLFFSHMQVVLRALTQPPQLLYNVLLGHLFSEAGLVVLMQCQLKMSGLPFPSFLLVLPTTSFWLRPLLSVMV